MRPIAAIALAGALLASSACTKGKPDPVPPVPKPGQVGVTMTISAAKAEFGKNESVALKVTLTNAQGQACMVYATPEASLVVVSFTVDGSPVVPRRAAGTYLDGMTSHLIRSLRRVAPGGSVEMTYESAATELDSSRLDSYDQAASTFWPVDSPGRYEVALRYIPAEATGAPADVCLASGEPASVSFTVLGA